jgi:thiol:disulfide interchange protein
METFKKAMGYFLLLAVVWILYFIPREDAVATMALLFAIWFACWLIGRLPITATGTAKAWSWAGGLAVVGLTYVIGFHVVLRPAAERQIEHDAMASIYDGDFDKAVKDRFTVIQTEQAALADSSDTGDAGEEDEKSELPWQPFGRSRFEALVTQRKTILIDFTADWCMNCKALEASVLNTRPVREHVDRYGVITMKADYTQGDEEITEMLEVLGSRQVPVIAIFPAGDPNSPIVFRGWYDRESLLDALQEAGPSASVSDKGRTAMRVQ